MQANLSSVVERFPTGERAGGRRSHPTSLSASRFDMVGWAVQIDAKLSVYRTITAASGNTITVDGDLTGLVTVDETEFCIIHPSGVDPENGATQTDTCVPESRYYYGGGRYMPPVVGFEMTHDGVFGIHGAQTGDNLLGQHYMWNRFFDINTGRFTTPDPAASPWSNLHGYVGANPITRTDPSGLGLSAQEMAYNYWHYSGWSMGSFNKGTCEDLRRAVRLAKFDLRNSSIGMGSGELKGAIQLLQSLYDLKCGWYEKILSGEAHNEAIARPKRGCGGPTNFGEALDSLAEPFTDNKDVAAGSSVALGGTAVRQGGKQLAKNPVTLAGTAITAVAFGAVIIGMDSNHWENRRKTKEYVEDMIRRGQKIANVYKNAYCSAMYDICVGDRQILTGEKEPVSVLACAPCYEICMKTGVFPGFCSAID